MATERLSDLGYLGIKKETTAGTAVIPNVFVPLYDESLVTSVNLDDNTFIFGNKAARYSLVRGQRHHMGMINIEGEPNTAGYFFDMLLNKTSTTGAGPYTHTFALNSTNPNSYTMEFQKGQVVFRYYGVQARQISPKFNKNKMELAIDVTALGEFSVRELSATPTGSNPYTITLATNYDPSPTTGLVTGDIMTLYKANGTTINFTVATITNGTTITTTTDVTSAGANDLIYLRGQTPSYTLQDPYTWARTEFRFAATASSALSATHTPVEETSDWTIMHKILPDAGAVRSGSYDPATLPRGQGDLTIKVKKFFDIPDEHDRFLTMTTRALVIRHFTTAVSGTNQELRITANDIRQASAPKALKVGDLIFENIDYKTQYNSSDSQMFNVVIINNVATI